LLSSAASLFPNVAIDTMAISYDNTKGISNRPISPCGMCRQALVEYEERVKQPIRLILGGQDGSVIVVEKANALLPFSFGSADLK
jgi:cytidine deaminase